MYDRVEQLAEASTNALKQYQTLIGGGSAMLLFCVSQQDKAEKQAEIMQKIAADIGVESNVTASESAQLKETASALHKKVQLYRANSPNLVVDMFEEGLSFLEKLCEKYM